MTSVFVVNQIPKHDSNRVCETSIPHLCPALCVCVRALIYVSLNELNSNIV